MNEWIIACFFFLHKRLYSLIEHHIKTCMYDRLCVGLVCSGRLLHVQITAALAVLVSVLQVGIVEALLDEAT
jgi:hypothetical protein